MEGLPQLQIEPEATELARARHFVLSVLEPIDVDALFLVAVSELITNAIEEHRKLQIPDPVSISVDPESVTVYVADRGRGFDPSARPDRDNLGVRGRGLLIAEAVAPGLRWEPNEPDGTIFVLPYEAG